MQSTGIFSSSSSLDLTSAVVDASSFVKLILYVALVWQQQSHAEARPQLRSLLPSPSLPEDAAVSAEEPVVYQRRHSRRQQRRNRKRMEERRRLREAAAASDVNLWLKLMAESQSLTETASSSSSQESSTTIHHQKERSAEEPSSSSSSSSPKDKRKPRNISPSIHGRILRRRQLYCRTGFHLQIHTDGTVNGTREDHNRYGILEFMPIMIGLQILGPQRIAIRGVESRRYLCMNKRGQLYGSKVKSDECEFMQTMEKNYYETWWSSKYPAQRKKSRKNGKKSSKRWYIALDREGHRRSGRKSRRTQKFTHFLTRPVDYRKAPFLFEARYVTFHGMVSSTEQPTLLPKNFENRISLDDDNVISSSSSSSSVSSSPSSSSDDVVIVIGDSSSSSSPSSSTSTASLKDNRVEPEAGRVVSRGRTRSHKKGRRGGRRKMRRKYAQRRKHIQQQFEKQLLQEHSKQVSKVFMVQNP